MDVVTLMMLEHRLPASQRRSRLGDDGAATFAFGEIGPSQGVARPLNYRAVALAFRSVKPSQRV